MTTETTVRRWPLVLIAAPAAVAIWSGWVGLGGLCGFGPIHPLPGIWDGAVINTAITLPIGVEAYGAYALRAWLTRGVNQRAQQFARASAIGSLVLGMCGQVIYHLLSAAHESRAPWPVVMLVSCIPVITLGFGAALTHLLREAGVTADATPAVFAAPYEPPGTEDDVRSEVTAVQAARTGIQPEAVLSGGPVPGGARREARTDELPGLADRDAVIAMIAEEIRDAIEAGERWHPDYAALMEATGRRRSFCEKAVKAARMAVFDAVPGDRTGTAAPGEDRTDADRTDGTPADRRTDDDETETTTTRTGRELALTGAT